MYTTIKGVVLLLSVVTMVTLSLVTKGSARQIWSLNYEPQRNRAASSNVDNDDEPMDEEQINEEMGVAEVLYEGDIVLTREQEDILEGQGGGGGEEQAWKNPSTKWPGGVVPYVLDRSLSTLARRVIHQAMEEIKQQTGGCISFKMRQSERAYVRFLSGRGCWSYLGRVGGRQDISIQNSGCATKGIAIHEIFHALGRFHEQSRPDRDEYISINFNNIPSGRRHNFNIRRTAEDHNLPYDFSSIMHYGAYDFAINRRIPVITPRVTLGRGVRIGQRRGLSERDIQHLKSSYCNGGERNGNNRNNRNWNWLLG